MEYKIIKLIGKGKGGYSYLGEYNNELVVVKKIHHEPCDYYNFGNKIQSEFDDYNTLCKVGIRIPKMLHIDFEEEIIIKEYIEGDVISDLIENNKPIIEYLPQLYEMANKAKAANLNIDYYPTNFVIRNGLLYYIDYECNQYMEEWSLEKWGLKYWL